MNIEENDSSADVDSRGFASPQRILSAFSLLSSATLLSVALSVCTNKIIAQVAGLEGMGLMGLYRNLGALVTGTLAFGFINIILQRVSIAKSRRETNGIIGAVSLLLACHALIVLVLAFTAASLPARWIFDLPPNPDLCTEIRIVLVMAFVNLALEIVTAMLKGQPDMKPVVTVRVTTSLASLLLIYPLLLQGRKGLAINVGSGGVVGACLGLYFVWRIFKPSISATSVIEKWRVLRSLGRPSLLLVVQSFGLMAGYVSVQAMVNHNFGLKPLGEYNSVILILETAVMVMMSSARTYALPSFGRLLNENDKMALFSRMMTLLLVVNTLAAAVMITAARPILWVLFSKEFVPSSELLAVLSLSLVAQAFGWSYNTFMLHKGNFGLLVTLDLIYISLFVGGAALAARLGLPLVSIVWAYTLACIVGALLYVSVAVRRYGRGYLSRRNAWLGPSCLAWLLLGYALSRLDSLYPSLAFLVACLAGLVFAAKRLPIRKWMGIRR